jgi:hypothetical protein
MLVWAPEWKVFREVHRPLTFIDMLFVNVHFQHAPHRSPQQFDSPKMFSPVGPTYSIFLDGDVAVFRNGDKHTA